MPVTTTETTLPAIMTELFDALENFSFMRYALFVGILSSFTFGVVGTFIVTRRISYIAAAISHSILGGIGASIYFNRVYGLEWLTPMLGAIAAALISAGVIGWVTLKFKEREDTIIAAIWTCGMTAGLLFIHYAPGQAVNLESYIFGDILLTSWSDVIATVVLAVLVLGLVGLFYHKLVAVCFDEEFTSLRGVSSKLYYFLLLGIVGICMVLLVRVAGIVLSIALIVLPAATASRFANRLWSIMILAVILSVIYNIGGLAFSFQMSVPTGFFIVVTAGVVYALSFCFKRRKN
ncbi:metal ABC transporter permease [Verrucomicrobiales bacterium]|nr:metal ABC transporter permease [Verrucomicrobiales bacterium]